MMHFYNQRNHQIWSRLSQQQRGLLIGYFIAGDPSYEQSLQMTNQALQAGIDVIELGVPSRNPVLDGRVIQRGHHRVMNQVQQDEWLMTYWIQLRNQVNQPIWAMGYKKELYQSKWYRSLVEHELIDALLIPDCTPHEHDQLAQELQPLGVDVVRFVHAGMSAEEIAQICKHATLIYAQAYLGRTGEEDVSMEGVADLYQQIRQHTSAFIMIGFGIRSPKKVKKAVASGYQGTVVGSALVEKIEKKDDLALYQLISDMKKELMIRKDESPCHI